MSNYSFPCILEVTEPGYTQFRGKERPKQRPIILNKLHGRATQQRIWLINKERFVRRSWKYLSLTVMQINLKFALKVGKGAIDI